PWATPTINGGTPITSYQVQRQASGDGSASGAGSTATAANNGTAYTNTGLTAGQHQRIRVAATNSIGTGPYSQPSDPLWALGVPARPDAPRITARGDHTLTLEVDPPADGGAPILEYGFEFLPLKNLARTATVTGPGIIRPEVVNDGAKHVTNSSAAYSEVTGSTSAGP